MFILFIFYLFIILLLRFLLFSDILTLFFEPRQIGTSYGVYRLIKDSSV